MKTRIPCPVPACSWYRDIEPFGRNPSNIHEQLKNHIDNLHPWYQLWLKYAYWNKRRKLKRGKKK